MKSANRSKLKPPAPSKEEEEVDLVRKKRDLEGEERKERKPDRTTGEGHYS